MKFILVENLNETQERTVYNALASWGNYAYKYGKSDALFELKYHFKLTDEELAWILKQLLKKKYIDENDFNWQIRYLKLEDYFPNKLNEDLDSASKELLDKFEGYYRIEDVPDDGSAYILPNGKFLNLFPATHEIFKDELDEYDVYFPYLNQSIQINDGNNPSDPLPNPYLHIRTKPTDAQYRNLLIWLDGLKNEKLDVWVIDKNNFYDLKEYTSDEIVKKIKKYFAVGRLDEAYLDDEEEFYDYGTGAVSGKNIFDVNKSENSFGKGMIKLAKTGEVDYKGRAAKIGEMTPKEYFEAVAKGFNSTYSSQIRQVEYDKNTLEHLRQVLTKYKRKFPITYLNLNPEDDKSFFQEGRHRMYIAGELFGWDTKFPVLQIYTKDRDKMAEIKKQENEARILKVLRRAVNKSKEYSYKNVDEIKTQLEYDIESELDDIYKYKKLSLLHDPKTNTLTLIMDGEDWLIIHLDEFNIDPNKKELDIDAEFDNISAEELAQLEKELGIKFNEDLNSKTYISKLTPKYQYESKVQEYIDKIKKKDMIDPF